MDPENEWAYEAEAIFCHACATAAKAGQEYTADDAAGLNITTRLKD